MVNAFLQFCYYLLLLKGVAFPFEQILNLFNLGRFLPSSQEEDFLILSMYFHYFKIISL